MTIRDWQFPFNEAGKIIGWSATGKELVNVSGTQNAVTYGADPTGVADSAAAFQAAVNAAFDGDEIYIPPGTYLVNSAVTQTSKRIIWVTANGFHISAASAANLFRDKAAPRASSETATAS